MILYKYDLESDEWSRRAISTVCVWDGEAVVWDSIAIMEYLADKVGRDRFWPKDDTARGMARAMVAEMHSSYGALRSECPMNIRKRFDGVNLTDACKHDIVRILGLWAEARARRLPLRRRTSRRRACTAASATAPCTTLRTRPRPAAWTRTCSPVRRKKH